MANDGKGASERESGDSVLCLRQAATRAALQRYLDQKEPPRAPLRTTGGLWE